MLSMFKKFWAGKKRDKSQHVLRSGKFNFCSKLDSARNNKLPSQVHRWGFKRMDEAKGKGKIAWPNDLQTLNPWPESWTPPRECSKKAWVKHYVWTLSLWPLHVLSLQVPAVTLHFNTPKGVREGQWGRDESYWGWIVLLIKIKHTP